MSIRLIAVVLVSLVASPLQAGVVFEIETQDHDHSPPRTETTNVQAEGRSLIMQEGGGDRRPGEDMIFRGDRREMIVVDHDRKSYMVMDRQFVQDMTSQINQAMGQVQGQMQDMLKNVPAAQRAAVAEMMKERMPQNQPQQRSKPQVRNLGKRADVYGYPCVLFDVVRDGRKIRDVWVTDWNNIKGGRELADTFGNMSTFFQELTDALPVQSDAPIQDNVFATLKDLGGFPVATREYRDDGSLESESALRNARRQRIDPAAFEPPAGYKRQSMFPGGLGSAPSAGGRYSQPRR